MVDTCGRCIHGKLVPNDLRVRACFGAPPTALVMSGPKGPQIINVRPTLSVDEPACGAFKQKILAELTPQHPG